MQRVDRVRALRIRIKGPRQSLVELLAVEMRVSGDAMAGRTVIVLTPRFQERIRLDEDDAVNPFFDPFPFKQSFANIAHMTKARIGFFGQVGDAPCAVWLTQYNAQNSGCLRVEDRTQRAAFSFRLICDGSINIDTIESEMGVPEKIEICDVVIGADRPRLRRQVGTDKHRNQTLVGIRTIGLIHMRHIVSKVIDRGTDKARCSIPFHLDYERVIEAATAQSDP